MNVQHNDASLSSSKIAQWASPEDWERHRQTIETLYLDEDKTLNEVMSTMANVYDHKGTMKMYKSRISKWRLDKNNRASDVAFILRKKTQRDAIKKPSAFRVRKRSVDIQDVLRYAERRTAQGRNFRIPSPGALTPSHISCRTPTPALSPSPHREDGQAQTTTRDDRRPQEAVFGHNPQHNDELDSNLDGEQQLVHPYSPCSVLCGTGGGHPPNFYSQRQSVPSVISPPQVWLIPQQLFATITSYFDGSFTKGMWVLTEDGGCAPRKELDQHLNHAAEFSGYCTTASDFIIQQSPAKGRQILSKAVAIIPEMLRVEDPSTLGSLLDALLILKRRGLGDVVSMLLNYFYEMAGIILSEDHPWFQISKLMTLLEPDHNATALCLSWRCAADAFQRTLGRLSLQSINYELTYLGRAHGIEHPLDVERHVRKLLADCEKAQGSNKPSSLSILFWLGHNLLHQGRFVEAEAVGQDLLARSRYIRSVTGHIKALDLSSRAQYYLNKRDLAEQNLRDAERLSIDRWGKGAVAHLKLKFTLEGWLRKWGRGGEADKLEQEIAELIGPDDLGA